MYTLKKSGYYSITREHLLNSSDINSITGLSEQETAERLKREGYNELPSAKQRSIFAIAFDVMREPMFVLLVACGIIYLILGDMQEALMLLGFVFVVVGITIYQERKTERAIEALRDLSSPRALVIRGGVQKRIPGRDVVCGDVVMLAEGDRVPADGVLLDGVGVTVDESLLTGESVPVRKRPDPPIRLKPDSTSRSGDGVRGIRHQADSTGAARPGGD